MLEHLWVSKDIGRADHRGNGSTLIPATCPEYNPCSVPIRRHHYRDRRNALECMCRDTAATSERECDSPRDPFSTTTTIDGYFMSASNAAAAWSAEQFSEQQYSLPDGGRFTELVRGVAVSLSPPDVHHGNAVLNLSKSLADYAKDRPDGYACFDLGIVVERAPDSVWRPAISWFIGGDRFSECDKTVTDSVPALVFEVVSTNDRRRGLSERILGWHRRGVGTVWVIDPVELRVHVIPANQPARLFSGTERVLGEPALPGFGVDVARIFEVPSWWKG